MTRHLKVVPAPAKPPEQRTDMHDYEWQQRQRMNAKRWDRLHVKADNAPPFFMLWRPSWWRGWR